MECRKCQAKEERALRVYYRLVDLAVLALGEIPPQRLPNNEGERVHEAFKLIKDVHPPAH